MSNKTMEKLALIGFIILALIAFIAVIVLLITLYVIIWPVALVATIGLCVVGMYFIGRELF